MPGFLERDEGEREPPTDRFVWDGVSGVRPYPRLRGDDDGGRLLRRAAAREVARIVRVPRAFVDGDLRVGAERT